jgi:4-carboxymuconolactone decarboxylase
MTKEPSAAERMIGDFAPKLVELTDDVLFGDIWERLGLSKAAVDRREIQGLARLNSVAQESRNEGHGTHG